MSCLKSYEERKEKKESAHDDPILCVSRELQYIELCIFL